MDNFRMVLTIIWAAGYFVRLWAVASDRFRLKPYGLPQPRSAIFRQSIINSLLTLIWFVYIPAWFVYRQVLKAQNKL